MTLLKRCKLKPETWAVWAAIASSIAAIVSMFLFGYQLISDNPKLDLRLKDAVFADYENESYIAVWISAFNKGKRPIGILESKLDITLPDHTKILFDEIPVFPRFGSNSEAHAPAIEAPFFYEPTYYDSFIKDKSGKEIPFDYHPHELKYMHRVFDTGTYRVGFIIYRLDQQKRNKVIDTLEKSRMQLVFETTDNKVYRPIRKINKWKKETFGKRFFIIKPPEQSNP
jgi:hypothetical protein